MTPELPLPIAACPNPECHYPEMRMDTAMSGRFHWIACPRCNYAGPRVPVMEDAVRLHNLICSPSPAADEGARAAEDICAYLMRECGHDTDNTDRAMIAGYVRQHSAVSPKAGRPQWMKEADCLLDRVAYELSQASMSAKLSDYMRAQMKRWSQALKEFRLVHLQPSSPPAVSVGEQEKER